MNRLALLLGWIPVIAPAHHSIVMFDSSQTVTLNGTVLKFEWTNPHVWLWVTVPGSEGSETQWGIESAAPLQLKRQGLSWDSFKSGDKITVTMHPMKDGKMGGQLISASLPDGRTFRSKDPAVIGGAAQAPP